MQTNKWGVMENVNSEFSSSSFRLSITLSCPLDLTLFPMDTQRCKMQLESCEYFWTDITSNMFLDFHFDPSYLLFKAIVQMWQRKGGRERESMERISRILDRANKKADTTVNSHQLVLLKFFRTKGALSMLISEITSEWHCTHCGRHSSMVRVSVQ